MNTIKKNIIANFLGSIWIALMNLAFVPLYIHFLGIESYGLVGFFSMLLGIFSLLDMGLSSTMSFEMARLSAQEGRSQEMKDLARTLEIPYWAIGLLLAFAVVFLAPWIASRWVQAKNIAPETVKLAVILMGLCIGFHWPMNFYSGGLIGLQQQVLLNAINISIATLRGLGSVFILWLISPCIESFFFWQIIISAANTLVNLVFFWKSLPYTNQKPAFCKALLKKIGAFATGMSLASITGILLFQLQKLILSHLLSLETFGYFSLANVCSMSIYRLVMPVFSAASPQMTKLAEKGSIEEITKLYHKSTQLVSILVLPVSCVMAFFSKEILILWTRNPVTAENTYLLLSILVLGTAFHSLAHIPWALQLAYGWMRLAIITNFFYILLLSPLMYIFTKWYGAIGAASIWTIITIGMLATIPIMHRYLLPGESGRWFLDDVGYPLCSSILVCAIARIFISFDWQAIWLIVSLSLVCITTFFVTACTANQLNIIERLKEFLSKIS
ncbi:MAG: oligosaccharide flippase family protein [Candidatus Brocadiae bacterium]|nr:oligosaccharide flippase family protein [Candidatus Brocadiia bacterium]